MTHTAKFFMLGCGMLLSTLPFSAQDKVTNAFDDLKRKGDFSSQFSEMQKAATPQQQDALLRQLPAAGYFCFTEDRLYDICRTDSLPQRWMSRSEENRVQFAGSCAPGEFYTWQIGIYSPQQSLADITVTFSDLKCKGSKPIKASQQRCFNLGGIDTDGEAFTKKLSVEKAFIQPLWMGIQIPTDAKGSYTGVVTVKAKNGGTQKIAVTLQVQGDPVANQGDDEGWRKSRLNWLDSRIGEGTDPTAPYTPIERTEKKISYLGGAVELAENGLPRQITTCYDKSNRLDPSVANPILSGEMQLVIETANGIEKLKPQKTRFLAEEAGVVTWQTELNSTDFQVTVTGAFHFDGFASYQMQVRSKKTVAIKDIRLEVPYTAQSSRYMMGLGHKGGFRPDSVIQWKWDVEKRHQDKIWMGDINAGLNFCFMDESYQRPLVNIYYALGQLRLPDSWGNGQNGGIHITPQADATLLSAYSGARRMEKNQTLSYRFNMLVTPVKPIDIEKLCGERFFHQNSDLSTHYIREAKAKGANTINVHHKKDIYPFINYPYYDEAIPDLKRFVTDAHDQNLRVRLYYTTRELTVKVPELWALRSLGSEVIHDGPGENARTLIHSNGPHAWLNKHLKTHFIPAWYNAFNEGKYAGDMDLSVITTPDSRWNNYYLMGLYWMIQNLGIDGVYIDDSALDRKTLQRARRVMDADGNYRTVDIHSWNHMNEWAGYANSLHLYLELLPYVDRTWIGEGFGAGNTPDFWLVEMSGIPFGLLSETLDARNPYRGMIYGMLPRLPWSGNPVPLWQLWDQFGMAQATMLGYWDERSPVTTTSDAVKATVFRQDGKALIVVANWSKQAVKIRVNLDKQKLGFIPTRISQPEISAMQSASTAIDLTQEIEIKGEKGVILLVE